MGSLIANVGSIASIGRAALTGVTPALDRIIARSDPALTFNFRVELPKLDGATPNSNMLNNILQENRADMIHIMQEETKKHVFRD